MLQQKRKHTIHEELCIDKFHCYIWFSVLMTHLPPASRRSLVSSHSVSNVMPYHSLQYGRQWHVGSKWLDIFTRF